jgi:rare lipoprotein A
MRRRIAQGLATMILVVGLGAAAQRPNKSESEVTQPQTTQQNAAAPKPSWKPYEVGTASWYGEDFDGRETASGEPFNMYDMTAAHPSLPLGSYVRVTNLQNRASIVVRVNDRGPVVDGRIIDLSYSAARALGFHHKGLQRVRLDVPRPQLYAQLRPVANPQ